MVDRMIKFYILILENFTKARCEEIFNRFLGTSFRNSGMKKRKKWDSTIRINRKGLEIEMSHCRNLMNWKTERQVKLAKFHGSEEI